VEFVLIQWHVFKELTIAFLGFEWKERQAIRDVSPQPYIVTVLVSKAQFVHNIISLLFLNAILAQDCCISSQRATK
jgi:hypothetical protein